MEKLGLDDFLNYKFLSGVEYSPNGKYACFVVHQANLEENGYNSNLWLYDEAQSNLFQLTAWNQEKLFTWLEDSKHILFSALRNPKDKERQAEGEDLTVFYKINVGGGEAREEFRVPLKVNDVRHLAADRFLLTAVYNPGRRELEGLSTQEKAEALEEREKNKDFEVLEEIPFWSNGRGFVSKTRSRLYLYKRQTHTWQALTGENLQVQGVQLNAEKTKAIVVGQEFEGKAEQTNALYLIDLLKETVHKITPEEEFSYSNAFFINDQQVICQGKDMKTYGLNENARFYLVSVPTGEKELFTPDFDKSTWNSVGSDCRYGGGEAVQLDGEHLYFLTTEKDSSYLNRLSFQGEAEQLTVGGGTVDSYSVRGGKILFIGLRGLKLQELYRWEQGQETALTEFNAWVAKSRKLSEPRPLSVETAPGVTIDGWVLFPVDYDPGRKYPGILNIHGGPKTVYGPVFFHEMQYWANQGYFVFFCNPRGSDGRGNEFADIRGKYGTVDYEDLMSFTDFVLERHPNIDEERLAVAGGSYGGFMTNWIIGHTDRFKAAASQRSISNWFSMGYTADIGYFFVDDQIGASPWSDWEKLWAQSPLKYADQVQTPTLFIHSEEDYRCWLPEGLQMFTALKYHGVQSRLCLFRGENHELSRSGKPRQRRRRLEEITNWFQRFLGENSNKDY
ncbi:MAG: S9 family peptidase [Firmicutes bacterium]|nr:S9 family peptidase [Bacillota bacterium]